VKTQSIVVLNFGAQYSQLIARRIREQNVFSVVLPCTATLVLRRFPAPLRFPGRSFSNFVFCDGQHRTAFDLSYLDEVLRKAGFRDVEESVEGQSRLYGETVPAFEPGDAAGLPHSVYVEAFR